MTANKADSAGRTVVLPTLLVELIGWYLTTHSSKYIVLSQRGLKLWPKAFYAQWDAFVDEIVPDLTFHCLRHSNKTWMIDDAIDKPLQYRQLGHRPRACLMLRSVFVVSVRGRCGAGRTLM